MTLKEFEQKRLNLFAEVRAALQNSDEKTASDKREELNKLTDSFEAERTARADAAALEGKTQEIPEAATANVEMGREVNNMEKVFNAASVEYKNAWLKNLAVDRQTGKYLLGAPTADEMNAMTTVANSGDIVPVEVQNQIIELVESQATIYNDATKSALAKGFAVPRHKAIAKGDAAVTAEGVANDDEENTWDQLEITGVEIKKHIVISRKMQFQSIDAFQNWVVTEMAARIATAKDKRVLAQLDDTKVGIAEGNVLTAQTYDDATIRKIFALIKAGGAKVVYANNATIWNGLFGIQDGNKRPIFIPNQTGDPIVQGAVYGAPVKDDENIADDVAYFGVPLEILANNFDDLTMSNFMDPKTFATTIGAYSLFDAGLRNPLAFVKVTFTKA